MSVGASGASSDGPEPPTLDASGRYVVYGPRSPAVIGLYLVLVGLLLYLNSGPTYAYPGVPLLLAAVLLVYLARYLSTRYVLDAETLWARRLFGSRRVRLEEVRNIEFANLRDLGPIGMFGTWGWRSRVFSPVVGPFDAIHTDSRGLFVTVGRVPMFLSPRDPVAFARELSRRARSWGVELPGLPMPVAGRRTR